ncbi:MAG: hypothetical protein IPJ51_18985 [Saprospiraceae bacterium]|nr:hypothetical protein [Saprospiraceae bacterium]
MKTVISFIIILISVYTVAGQSNKTDKLPRWEIGLDILPLLKDTSYHMKESVLLKYRIGDKVKLRTRVGIYFDDVNNQPSHPPYTDTIWGYRPRVYFSFGIEKPLLMVSKVHIYWGVDAFIFYNKNDVYRHSKALGIPPTENEAWIDDREYKTGINAFIYGEYHFTDHFSLNLEAFWQFAYRYERYYNKEYRDNQLFTEGGRTIKRFLTQVQPISSINLMYKF